MANFNSELQLATELIGFDQYEEMKTTALGLMQGSGVSIRDSDYELDFAAEQVVAADWGEYTQLIRSVRVAIATVPHLRHESLLIEIGEIAHSPLAHTTLFNRNVGITVYDHAVTFARVKTVFPRSNVLIPEAQPIVDLKPAERADIETWEHELRKTDNNMSRFMAGMVLAELHEFATIL